MVQTKMTRLAELAAAEEGQVVSVRLEKLEQLPQVMAGHPMEQEMQANR